MADASGGEPAPKMSFFKRKLRRASFISASTGERSRRQFTLREASHRMNGSTSGAGGLALGHDGRDSGHDDTAKSPLRFALLACWAQLQQARAFAVSPTGQSILKCSLAYLLGCTATLVPALSARFGHQQDSKHMVATVTVWFHPARTLGSMHEATGLAVLALLYAALVAFTSMALSLFCRRHGLLAAGHALVLLVFVGGGLGVLAWVKQRMGRPLVNVATSLASIGCITILIREGAVQAGTFSVDRAAKVVEMVVLGIAFSTAVNVLVLPTLARRRLSEALETNTDLLGEMLISVARAFLSGREDDLEGEYHQTLAKEHQDSLNALTKHLAEARGEQLFLGRERLVDVQASLVECLTGLSQDLGGLRSAAFAQFAFIRQEIGAASSDAMERSSWPHSPVQTPAHEDQSVSSILSSIAETAEHVSALSSRGNPQPTSESPTVADGDPAVPLGPRGSPHPSLDSTSGAPWLLSSTLTTSEPGDMRASAPNVARSPGEMFLAFINQLGPPTKSLVFTLKQILDELPFKEKPNKVGHSHPWADRPLEIAINEHFHASLGEAMELYRESRNEALNALYQSRAMTAATTSKPAGRPSFSQRKASVPENTHHSRTPSGVMGRQSSEVLADIEEVSACCGHFSFALLDFADDVVRFLDILEELKHEMAVKRRSWTWLFFWRHSPTSKPRLNTAAVHEAGEEHAADLHIPSQIKKADDFADAARALREKPWYYAIYRALRFFRRDDIRFAIKVGIGAALYALPAFLETTRPFFVHWRGEWGLVSYMAVCCMTIGASNTTGIQRFVGTFIGACLAVLCWVLASKDGNANPWILGFLGWMVSVGCFYLIIAKERGPLGRFILLTWNLGALYSYSLSVHDDDNDDDEGGINPAIWSIVLHRLVAVCAGTVWGIFVTRWIWPTSARLKLREGLCVLWLRMGLIWKRDPLAMFLLGEPQTAYMDIREEADLQSFLGSLRGLRASAASEFELRGPFPDESVGRMLDRTGRMLDAFHAMNVVIAKNARLTPGEQALMRYTRPERIALSGRISHLFTVLASSLKLQYPINDVLPSIENSRDRLLTKISEFRRQGEERDMATEQDFEMLYAYVLVTGQLAQDIQVAGDELEKLFGTLNEESLKLE